MPSIKSNSREASRTVHCPLCDRDHYCFLVGDPIEKVICQWTDPNHPPEGWNYAGESKDRRPMFNTAKKRHKSRRFPDLVTLPQTELADPAPEWQTVEPVGQLSVGDIVRNSADGQFYQVKARKGRKAGGEQRLFLTLSPPGQNSPVVEALESECSLATNDPETGATFSEIRYLYPDPVKKTEFAMVVRRQWTDRRQWLEDCRKTKEVRPYHWQSSGETGEWVKGRGERPWPLYREDEAKEAILNGGVVFAVGGEQAVEVYRDLGQVATTCAGGETHWETIAARLEDCFAAATRNGLKPVLAIHPDFDLAGDSHFGQQLLKECGDRDIPAIAMNPQDIWGQIPHGGDIKDIVEGSGLAAGGVIKALEHAIDEAIDRQGKEEKLILQRRRWNAPDAHFGELGYWKESESGHIQGFTPLTNFDFQVEKEVASPEGGGFVLQLKRAGEHQQFRVFLPSMDFTSVQTFENTLKKALGGALICRLTTNQMKSLLRVRLHEYAHNRGGKVYKLCQRVGQQPDGYWVFPRLQLTPKGEATDENKSLWIWNTGLTGDESTLPKPAIAPPQPNALRQLVEAMEVFFGPKNIYPALLTLGYGAASVHYQEIIETEGAFPILNPFGDAGSGKTTAGQCALSLVGMHTEAAGGLMREVSVSAAYERLKIAGSLIHCLDDPARTPELDEFLKGLYNGKARLVRGQNGASFNMQRPHSPLMVTSNFACGETNAATMSRMLLLWFDNKSPGQFDTYHQLAAAWDKASGCLPDLIKLGYPKPAIAVIEADLVKSLPLAHNRIARSLALIVAYTEAICQLAEVGNRLNIRQYAVETVCAMANDSENSGDSLRDFVEKLFILRSQAKAGEWNMRFICKHNSSEIKSLALNLPTIWNTLDGAFKLPYNLSIIKHLLQGHQSNMTAQQKFHMDEDVSRAFQRGATQDPKWQTKRCVEIPIDVIRKYVEAEENVSTESTDPAIAPESPASTEDSQLTSICQLNVNRDSNSQLNGEGGDQLTENRLSTEAPVDSTLSTEQTHAPQGFEPSSEAQLTQLTEKCVRTHTPEPPLYDSGGCHRLTPGTRCKVLIGQFTGSLVEVVDDRGDEVEVHRSGWAISREYSRDELEVLSHE
ncbi:hypothetical protein H6F75_22365 [Nodosilinea sp. FACHB-131]|uniref:hypothetical protein n=1 Tax=Cyanophyceae TaxID=3028117 RepID=UPI001685B18E|nr:hypothetical protein [Nodosilinea sp. FACHB-131]MBD1876234.1 hypothetical protein [Nodosilinea sp. FACHB-131]